MSPPRARPNSAIDSAASNKAGKAASRWSAPAGRSRLLTLRGLRRSRADGSCRPFCPRRGAGPRPRDDERIEWARVGSPPCAGNDHAPCRTPRAAARVALKGGDASFWAAGRGTLNSGARTESLRSGAAYRRTAASRHSDSLPPPPRHHGSRCVRHRHAKQEETAGLGRFRRENRRSSYTWRVGLEASLSPARAGRARIDALRAGRERLRAGAAVVVGRSKIARPRPRHDGVRRLLFVGEVARSRRVALVGGADRAARTRAWRCDGSSVPPCPLPHWRKRHEQAHARPHSRAMSVVAIETPQ